MTIDVRGSKAFVLLALAIAGCSAGTPTPSASSSAAFTAVLRAVSYDYEPFDSPAQLANAADAVVVGRITAVAKGRTLEAGPQATLTVAVERTIKGQGASTIFIEIPTAAGAGIDEIRASIPDARLILFLADRTAVPAIGVGGDAGESQIFTPYPQGVIIEDGHRFVGGVEDLAEMSPAWNAPADFDSFIATLMTSRS